MAPLYDGPIAFLSTLGVVGVVPTGPDGLSTANVQALSLNGESCDDSTVPDDELESVSNSIAADEEGGIYAVTSHGVYGFRWDGERLSQV
jgi:hypothetical protein